MKLSGCKAHFFFPLLSIIVLKNQPLRAKF